MPNVTIADLLAAQAALVSPISNIGSVLTRERYITGESYINLFMALNHDQSPNGVMILFQEFSEQMKGPRICTVQQRIRFSYEVFHKFDDKLPNDRTSHEEFIEKLQAINDALNTVVGTAQPWNLGITTPGADVEHQFLQGDGVLDLRLWGTGSTAIKTHYVSMTLDVLVVNSVHVTA
jgi:hypothetical protein